jgi:hypothetical protein
MINDPFRRLRQPFVPYLQRRAEAYLKDAGVMPILVTGRSNEVPIVPYDLYNIHSRIRKRRPRAVLEFGVGFSTLAILHALALNGVGHLWTIDADEKWIENLRSKVPPELASRLTLRHSPVELGVHEGTLVHHYTRLPNIVPDFCYLDAPHPNDVTGEVRGLTYQPENSNGRHMIAADILLYESTLNRGFFLLVDGRKWNVLFLRQHLKRNYRMRWNKNLNYATFVLQDF